MSSICAVSGATDSVGIYYLIGSGTSYAMAASVTKSGGGTNYAVLIAFGVQGYASSGSAPTLDPSGACSTGAGSTNPSGGFTTLSYANDFVVAGAAVGGTSTATISSGTSIASASPATTFVGVAGFTTSYTGGSATISWTASGSSWQESIVAIEASAPIAVPFMPYGILPLVLAIPILYLAFTRKTKGRSQLSSGTP